MVTVEQKIHYVTGTLFVMLENDLRTVFEARCEKHGIEIPGGGPNFGIPAGTYGQKRDATGRVINDHVFSFNQTAGSITHSRPVKVPNPQSVLAITRSRSPTASTASCSRRETTSGCSTIFVVVSITPGISTMCFGNGWRRSAAYSC